MDMYVYLHIVSFPGSELLKALLDILQLVVRGTA